MSHWPVAGWYTAIWVFGPSASATSCAIASNSGSADMLVLVGLVGNTLEMPALEPAMAVGNCRPPVNMVTVV